MQAAADGIGINKDAFHAVITGTLQTEFVSPFLLSVSLMTPIMEPVLLAIKDMAF